ncbi:MAG TPA: hypothetical protein VFO70_12120, partial [Chitinophagaceae bacterium]|nr:hypothetical protein [Chitinophagaceae bacterium]
LEKHYMPAMDGKPVEGIALRLFNPATRLWSIYWADSRSATLDTPMVGSFQDNIGYFYARDLFQGKPILVKFKWDATNPGRSVWSQAFSADNGKTWEWNWHMNFFKDNDPALSKPGISAADNPGQIGVIELRNYELKEGKREMFHHYFETNLIQPQMDLNGFPLGQYRIKGQENNFFWIRGFENMQTRSVFLPSFYYGAIWKQHRNSVNPMIANNDNVHLLRPLVLQNNSLEAGTINSSQLRPGNRIAVIDYYISNTKLDQLLDLFSSKYLSLLEKAGIKEYTLWKSELTENDFPQLPVFQDKNLLVTIAFYKDESEYQEKLHKLESMIEENLRTALQDAITIRNTLILYPGSKTIPN